MIHILTMMNWPIICAREESKLILIKLNFLLLQSLKIRIINKLQRAPDKLRKKVDTMIVKYMKTIEELKKDNKKLNNKFDIAYEMHTAPRKKKLDKLLSE